MNDFLQTALTFPTLPWSIFFTVCAAYWVLAATGLAGHHHADGGPHDVHHGGGHQPEAAGLLTRLGLNGVPLMVMLASLSFCGWLVCYFTQLLLLNHLPPPARLLPGVLTVVLALFPALVLTNLLIRPARKVFAFLNADETKRITGRVGTIITPQADEQSGMAQVDDGGAGLLLQVRTRPGERYRRGQRVVLLDYDPAGNSYLIADETEF